MFKLLITAIALYWLYLEVIQPRYFPKKPKDETMIQRKKGTGQAKRFGDEDGEYVDYEELP